MDVEIFNWVSNINVVFKGDRIASSMAHSQYAKRYPLGKSIRDRARNKTHPNIDNKMIWQQIEELVKPCVYNQQA